MSHRFTALVLALIVASPLCCCGWMHAAEKAHVESCCEAKEAGKPVPKDKDCVCAQTPKFRDVSHARVAAPAPDLFVLDLPLLAITELEIPFIGEHSAALVLRNHGPPPLARPLYHRDCALLI